MAAKKNKSASTVLVDSPTGNATALAAPADVAGRFIGQWSRLVSTTNWEKGRIICQWRDALVAAAAAAADYSDEAWSQLVGGVTSQHVGRLRRVFQRFGDAFDQYDGLYWSHFQAAIDWEDAEMWLEGAILQNWSVSQMRGKRWETVGKPGEQAPFDETAESDELDDDAMEVSDDEAFAGGVSSVEKSSDAPKSRAANDDADDSADEPAARSASGGDDRPTGQATAKQRSRLAVEVDDLPDDLADAFEQFKLAIITQRRLRWSETTPSAVIECLDALRELTLAPSDD